MLIVVGIYLQRGLSHANMNKTFLPFQKNKKSNRWSPSHPNSLKGFGIVILGPSTLKFMCIHVSIIFWIFHPYLCNHSFFVLGTTVFLHNLVRQLVYYLLWQMLSFLCLKQFPSSTDFPLALVLRIQWIVVLHLPFPLPHDFRRLTLSLP